MTAPDSPILPAHVEHTIEAIAELHRQHHRRTTPTQRLVNRMTSIVARPRFVGVLTFALAVWLLANTGLEALGWTTIDPAPFNGLQVFAGVAGVYITVLVLITQRQENELSEARDKLTLELAIVNEQKSAKIIALLEELRRDTPSVPNRPDEEADQLSVPADTHAVVEALRSTTEIIADPEPTADAGQTNDSP
jgi:uncharacterized membrane protein